MGSASHWQGVYTRRSVTDVSWYAPRLERSLELIARAGLAVDDPIVDIGGGASTLVDDLLGAGHREVTVLDVAPAALEAARERLGVKAGAVRWVAADVLTASLPEAHFALWHDRAVFHFLTDAEQRRQYVAQVLRAVRPGGHVIVATFAPEGPDKCSGLPVARYDADGIHAEFGVPFEKLWSVGDQHRTPAGGVQAFTYCHCLRRTPG